MATPSLGAQSGSAAFALRCPGLGSCLHHRVEAGKSTVLRLRSGGASPPSECPVILKSKSPHTPPHFLICVLSTDPGPGVPRRGSWGVDGWGAAPGRLVVHGTFES